MDNQLCKRFCCACFYDIFVYVGRPRPTVEMLYPLLGWVDYSFPSMHAMVSFAALPILDKEFPKLRWFWAVFAVLVALSRVYFKVHYLSDIVFGAAIGYLIGLIVMRIEQKYGIFKKWR